MKWNQSHLLLAAGLVLALIGSTLSLSSRISVERNNKNVMLSAEFDTIEGLGSSQGLTIDQATKKTLSAGFGGVVISEQTIGELLLEGKAQIISLSAPGDVTTAVSALKVADPTIFNRVSRGLAIRFGDLARRSAPRGNILALPPVDANTIRNTAVGLSPSDCESARAAGLKIIARGSNPPGISSRGVKETLAWFKEQGATVFLPQGDQVLGRREAVDAAVAGLRESGLLYASPEFTKLGGDIEMLAQVPELVVRLHSAQLLELDRMSEASAIERYSKAARERGMRILLLRPLTNAAERPLNSFGDFATNLQAELRHVGLSTDSAEPYGNPQPPAIAKILIGIGGAICVFWTISNFLPAMVGVVLAAVASLVPLAGGLSSGSLSGYGAFVISVFVPIAGFILIEQLKPKAVILSILIVMATALIAGLCVAGLLNDSLYMIRAKTFPGVKVAVFAPILAVGWFFFSRLCDTKESMRSPITWGSALLGVVIVGVLGFMISRSGNDGPAGVIGGELEFRGLLERILPVRPRTKEFLLGFPALTVGLWWYARAGYDARNLGNNAGWVALLIMLGAIASTDVVNTFCHIHTPVLLSLLRVFEGLVLGCILGGIVVLVGSRYVVWRRLRTVQG